MNDDVSYDIVSRPRRLRTTPAMRRFVAETRLDASDLILPVFVKEGITEPQPLTSMPGVVQHSMDSLRRAAAEAVELGLGGFMVFGVPATRDAEGSAALDPEGILNRGIRAVREEVGDGVVVMADLCLDEFTDHGHCGVLDAQGRVDNDRTLEIYGRMAVAQAEAGAHMLGPSGMMDGQVGVIRAALDAAGREDVSVLAYTAKYSSAFYGPFREAVDSTLTGDRKTYQMDPANRREALLELQTDLAEGADMVMVKPGLPYLDIVWGGGGARWATWTSGERARVRVGVRGPRTRSRGSARWSRPRPPTGGSTARPRSASPCSPSSAPGPTRS